MENASKALLMAAGILISILIISLAVYLFTTFRTLAKNTNKQIEENQLGQFNTQFIKYSNVEDGITIYDVITIANLAKENNANYGLTKTDFGENSFYIQVDAKKLESQYSNLEANSQEDYNSLIENNLKNQNTYKCKVDISPKTGRVYKVTITEK